MNRSIVTFIFRIMKVNCKNPQLIINPLASELIAQYGVYVIRGRVYECRKSKRSLYVYEEKNLNVSRNNITASDLDDCYIANPYTGRRWPLYMEVPCGHCDNCKSSKIAAFVHRCELETQMYDSKPIFLTLTYNEEHKPENGLSVRDVQLFFKRLRINLYRQGYRRSIRYVVVGEYGRNTKRPHYHAILWNLGQTDLVSYRKINKIIEKSWRNGFILSRIIEPSDNKTFYYTSKYLRKDCSVPEGCKETFICSSNRNGGIGCSFVRGLQRHIYRTLDTEPKFLNKWSGEVKDLQLNRYVLNKVLPSISTSVPCEVKKSLRTLNLVYAYLAFVKDKHLLLFNHNYELYNRFFGKYLYCPQFTAMEFERDMKGFYESPITAVRDALAADMILRKWYNKGEAYFERSKKLDKRRQMYLQKLFENAEDITAEVIRNRAFKYRKSAALAAQRELF